MTKVPGNGSRCYIESLCVGLVRRNRLVGTTVQEAAEAIAAPLEFDNVRLDGDMIDAGNLQAAEVRDTIFQTIGVNVGVTVIQYNSRRDRLVAFQATAGDLMICLLYTPGHFDFVEIDDEHLAPLLS